MFDTEEIVVFGDIEITLVVMVDSVVVGVDLMSFCLLMR